MIIHKKHLKDTFKKAFPLKHFIATKEPFWNWNIPSPNLFRVNVSLLVLIAMALSLYLAFSLALYCSGSLAYS